MRKRALVLLCVAVSCATLAHGHSLAPPTSINVDSQLAGGKLQWTPPSTTIRNSSAVTLTVSNPLKDPENFEIPGLVDETVIAPGTSKVFTFDADISGTYFFKSSNHPGYGTAKLIILR